MKKLLLLLLLLPVVFGHSSEDVVVRSDFYDKLSTYTFSCSIPSGAYEERYWALRTDDNDVPLQEKRGISPAETFILDEKELYHLGCEVQDSEGVLLRGDFHIDRRTSADNTKPYVTVYDTASKSFSASCIPPTGVENYVLYWFLNGDENIDLTGFEDQTTISYQVPYAGLWDINCGVWDIETQTWYQSGLPVEFFEEGPAYIPDEAGCVPHEGCPEGYSTEQYEAYEIPEGETVPTLDLQVDGQDLSFVTTNFIFVAPDEHMHGKGHVHLYVDGTDHAHIYEPNYILSGLSGAHTLDVYLMTSDHRFYTYGGSRISDSQDIFISEENKTYTNTTDGEQCAYSVEDMPVLCTGDITLDFYDGCRHVVCEDGASSLTVLACNKPDKGQHQYFEVYKQLEEGSGMQICLGETCISDNGYASEMLPICTGGIQTNETEPPVTNETSGAAYYEIKDIPASCQGGEIISDIYDGGRHIRCLNSDGSLSISGWDKPGINDPQYFELYKKEQSAEGIKVCIADVCIAQNGYAKSTFYPIFYGENQTDNRTESTNETILASPTWLSHSGTTGVSPSYFHLEIVEADVISTDWEIWNSDEVVWQVYNATDLLRYHVHTHDGIFVSLEDQLQYSTAYRARARFMYQDGMSDWSAWRDFTTMEEPILNTSSPTWTTADGFAVERFASELDVPVHLARAPEIYGHLAEDQRPLMYVTELYGKVKVIYPDGSQSTYAQDILNYDPFGSITGAGQMGVIGLYADEQGYLYVGTVYREDSQTKNKIIRFTSSEDGNTYVNSTVIIDELPSAPSHQIEQITEGPDGRLYVNLGDAQSPSSAQDDSVLAGKIISMNKDGSDVQEYAKGFRNPFGADWRPGYNQLFATDNAPDQDDRIVHVMQGENYGWGISDDFATWHEKALFYTDVSPVDVAFNPGGTGFPDETTGRMYVAVAGPIYTQGPTESKHILEMVLDDAGNIVSHSELVKYTGDGYGTPVGLEFGPDGLYFTDMYGEAGFTGYGSEGGIYKVSKGSQQNMTYEEFRATIFVSPWFPKLIAETNTVQYEFTCNAIDGSRDYLYDWHMGDGSKLLENQWSKKIHAYPYIDQEYEVSCTAHDQATGESRTASMYINPIDYIG